jgi:hypothetical protein
MKSVAWRLPRHFVPRNDELSIQVNVILLPEARRADTEKYQVTLAGIGDALLNSGRNSYNIQHPCFNRRSITNHDLSRTLQYHVALNRPFKPV